MTTRPPSGTGSYSKFEPNQILTAEQLNGLAAFLEEQGRLSRTCLGGAGIVRGLRPRVETGTDGRPELFLSEGCGVTTDGYLIRLRPEAAYTHYRDYRDPAGYGFFGAPAVSDTSNFLFELLTAGSFDPDDKSIKRFEPGFLGGRILVAYLEIREVDLASCTGDDCDEKGIRIDQAPRLLALAADDLRRLESAVAAGWGFPNSRNREEYGLPPFRLARAVGLCRGDREAKGTAKGREWTAAKLDTYFRSLVAASDPGGFGGKLERCYEIYRPLLQADFPTPPFAHRGLELGRLPTGSVQYVYDWLRDLYRAYAEFTSAAFDLTAACGPERPAFPRHLVLGEAPPADGCRPSEWRQEFLPSPILVGGEGARARVRGLFARIVFMIRSFSVPDPAKSGAIRVTPSRDGDAPLGDRAIPFYYSGKDAEALRECWSFDLRRRCRVGTVPAYEINEDAAGECRKEDAFFTRGLKEEGLFTEDVLSFFGDTGRAKMPGASRKAPERHPLLSDCEGSTFFRVEGHLGQSFRTAYAELSDMVSCFNLPFQVTGVKLGAGHGNIDLDITGDCRFEDLEAIYLSHRSDLFCVLDRAADFFLKLKYDQPEPLTEPSERPKVTARVLTENGEPMAGAAWKVMDAAKRSTRQSGRTRKDGRLEILGLEEGGLYVLDLAAVGYQGRSIKFTFPTGKALVLKDIPLRSERKDYAWFETGKAKVEVKANSKAMAMAMAEAEAETAVEAEAEAEGKKVKAVAGEGGAAVKNTANVKSLADYGEGSIGYIVAEMETGGKRQETLAYVENFLYKYYPEFEDATVKVVLDQIYYPMQLSVAIREAKETMPPAEEGSALGAFNEPGFTEAYAGLLRIIKSYRGQLANFLAAPEKSPYAAKTLQEILGRLDDLEAYCIDKFREFLRAYRERREALQKLHLFSVYACKHPGLEHLGGVPRGGTFVLVYGEDSQVVFDFALPYLCCSDSPPVTLCLGAPVVFKLPKETFCTGEDHEYLFIVSPPGGVVTGAGVRRDARTGDHYFRPTAADVKPGIVAFQYHAPGGVHPLSVLVEEFKAQIRYEILEIDADARTARVALHAFPEGEQVVYAWDFGGGVGASTRLEEKTFSTADGPVRVALSVTRGDCVSRVSLDIPFRLCDATFAIQEVSQDLETATYVFSHPQEAKTRVWTFDGVKGESGEPDQKRTFKLGDKVTEVKVTLAIEHDRCADTYTTTLNLPARRTVQFGLPEASFCKDDPKAYPFLLEPSTGRLDGKGISLVGGKPHFVPSMDEVQPGTASFTYTVSGASEPARLDVQVVDLVPDIRMEKPVIDPVKRTASVQFHADPPGAEYQWTFGDGKTSEGRDPANTFDLSDTQQFVVELTVKLGKCVKTVKEPLAFEVCNADFTLAAKVDGVVLAVAFTATRPAAKTTYTWLLGPGEGQVVTGSPVYVHRYKLRTVARIVTVGLKVAKDGDACTHSTEQNLEIPALADATISLDSAEFVVCDDSEYAFNLNPPGGTVKGPGVRASASGANSYEFNPTRVGLAIGEVRFDYYLPSPDNRTAAFKAIIHKPSAKFSVDLVRLLEPSGIEAKIINESSDADTFRWTFDIEGLPPWTSTEREPKAVRFDGVETRKKFVISLSASWGGRCPSSFRLDPSKVRWPNVISSPPGSPTVPGDVILRPGTGTIVTGGVPALPTGMVINLERERNALTTLRLASGLSAGDSLLERTESSSSTLSSGLGRAETRLEIASGAANNRLAATLGGLIDESLRRIDVESTAAQREILYRLLAVQILQLINAVTVQEMDLRADDPLFVLVAGLPARLAGLRRLGVKLDPGGLLAEALASGLESDLAKPNVTQLWRNLIEAVST